MFALVRKELVELANYIGVMKYLLLQGYANRMCYECRIITGIIKNQSKKSFEICKFNLVRAEGDYFVDRSLCLLFFVKKAAVYIFIGI